MRIPLAVAIVLMWVGIASAQSTRAYGYDPAQTVDICTPSIWTPSPPSVVLFHGGAFQHGDKSDMAFQCQNYAAKGYYAYAPNYRLLSIGPPIQHRWPEQIADAQLIVRWIRASQGLTGKLCAFGVSAGATLASLLGTLDAIIPSDVSDQFPDASPRADCSVVNSPVGNWIKFRTFNSTSQQTTDALFDYPAMGDGYVNSGSPVYKIKPDSSPAYISHGKQDTTIPIAQSYELMSAYQNAGVTLGSWFYDGGHVFAGLTSIQRNAILMTESKWVDTAVGR